MILVLFIDTVNLERYFGVRVFTNFTRFVQTNTENINCLAFENLQLVCTVLMVHIDNYTLKGESKDMSQIRTQI